ncbi:hypothetical protein THAOC_17985, partial [Thalassiosira oceanica]
PRDGRREEEAIEESRTRPLRGGFDTLPRRHGVHLGRERVPVQQKVEGGRGPEEQEGRRGRAHEVEGCGEEKEGGQGAVEEGAFQRHDGAAVRGLFGEVTLFKEV